MARVALILVFLMASDAFGGALTAQMNRTRGDIDDRFYFTLSIQGSIDEEVTLPDIPGLTLEVTNTSKNYTFVNGRFSGSVNYSVTIIPEKIGKYTIPTIKAKIDGKEIKTLPLQFEVLDLKGRKTGQSPVAAAPAPANKQGKTTAPQPDVKGKASNREDPVFIEREFSTKSPYVGEQVVMRVKLYHRIELSQPQFPKMHSPDLRRFQTEGARKYREIVGGRRYNVYEQTEVLFATKAGKIEIPPNVFKGTTWKQTDRQNRTRDVFDILRGQMGFGRRVQVEAKSPVDVLDVKAVPQGKPNGYRGLVGNFQLETKIDRKEIKKGETVTVTFIVSGYGLLDTTPSPKVDYKKIGRVYPDKPTSSERIDANGLYQEKVFKFAIVPKEEGVHKLGKIEITAFNPKIEKYVYLQGDPGEITVHKPDSEETPLVVKSAQGVIKSSKKNVKILGSDLIGIHRGKKLLENHSNGNYLVYAVVGGAALSVMFFSLGLTFWREKSSANIARRRRHQALKGYKKEQQNALEQVKTGNVAEGLKITDKGFRTFVGDKLNLHGQALTEKDIWKRLEGIGLEKSDEEELITLVDNFSKAEFGGDLPGGNKAGDWITALTKLVMEIDKRC